MVQGTEEVEPPHVKGGEMSNWVKSSLSKVMEGFLLQMVYTQGEEITSVRR